MLKMVSKNPQCKIAKQWLRDILLENRKNTPRTLHMEKSRKIGNRLFNLPQFRKAKVLATFLSFGSEVDTWNILRKAWSLGKTVLVPFTGNGFHKSCFVVYEEGDVLCKTSYGPLELVGRKKPASFQSIDVMLVPGLGFDENGYRLGYGGGVYDRIFKKSKKTLKIGMFFDFQGIFKLPIEHTDQPLNSVLTENRTLFFR